MVNFIGSVTNFVLTFIDDHFFITPQRNVFIMKFCTIDFILFLCVW